MNIKIESNIPIPARTRKPKYPFADLEPGQSFHVPGLRSVQSARVANRNLAPRKFRGKPDETGVRFWRVA